MHSAVQDSTGRCNLSLANALAGCKSHEFFVYPVDWKSHYGVE